MAERRQEVFFWATIAGNLDVEGWAALHRVFPLTESLNPAPDKREAASLPQAHVVGSRDGVMPPWLARACCEGLPVLCRVVEMPGMGHGDAWAQICPDVLNRVRPFPHGTEETDTATR